MVYVCPKCGRWLRCIGVKGLRILRLSEAKFLFCPRCKVKYNNPSYEPDRTPLWKHHPDLKQTKKGHYYRLIMAKNWNTLILFHHYNWYPPTEKEILESKDEELIKLYRKVDGENFLLQQLATE